MNKTTNTSQFHEALYGEAEVNHHRDFFVRPRWPAQRLYEALRTFYVERVHAREVARRFGYRISSFNTWRSRFAQSPDPGRFFVPPQPRRWRRSRRAELLARIVGWRKQFWSIDDIVAELGRLRVPVRRSYVQRLLREEGFARLPRRREEDLARIRAARERRRSLGTTSDRLAGRRRSIPGRLPEAPPAPARTGGRTR